MVKIFALQKTTLQDFPERVACIVFLSGCNFRCVYCHNPAAVSGKANVSEEDFFSFLDSRIGRLQGVVVSGGEPTVHPDLVNFIAKIKRKGFLVKLDTNGAKPHILEELFKKKLVDYVAMDVKAPFAKYRTIAAANGFTPQLKRSIKLIMKSGVDYEFRTTCHPSLSHDDFVCITNQIRGAKRYFLQAYVDDVTLNPQKHLGVYNNTALESLKNEFKHQFPEIGVR